MVRRHQSGVRDVWIAAAVGVLALSSVTACGRDSRPAQTVAKAIALRTTTVRVDGMSCQVCAGSVKNALKKVDGVDSAEISLEKHTAVIHYDAYRVHLDHLTRAIKDAGFKAGTPEPAQSR